MFKADLEILVGKHRGKTIPLNAKRFFIGREFDCHLRPSSDLVSRHHCVLLQDGYSLRLRDLGSSNGTCVNGVRTGGEVSLCEGDRITIGLLEFQVHLNLLEEISDLPPTSTIELTDLKLSALAAASELTTKSDAEIPSTDSLDNSLSDSAVSMADTASKFTLPPIKDPSKPSPANPLSPLESND